MYLDNIKKDHLNKELLRFFEINVSKYLAVTQYSVVHNELAGVNDRHSICMT